MAEQRFLAFDLGAESGRGLVGSFDGTRVKLEEACRFSNSPVKILDTLHWDVLRLFAELKRGLGVAAARDRLGLVAMGAAGVQVHVGMRALMQTHPSSSSITCSSA